MAFATLAFATGAEDNAPFVDGSVKPKKLDKKKYKPINLFAGVRTEGPVGESDCHPTQNTQCNPEQEFIEFGKNLKWDSNAAPFCTAPLDGTTTEQAKQLCPAGSVLGEGGATVRFPPGEPGGANTDINDEVVTAFNGPGNKEIRLHAYSPTLTETNTQVVFGKIVRAQTKGYKVALRVEDAPDAAGDAAMITVFNTTIEKKTGVAQGRCKKKKFQFLRTVTYDDGTSERSAPVIQECKRKK